ncbi:MAG: Ferric transporter ATP-binding subunit [Dehalococcoidia bacterium]|nr:Ferric transporter ATP-binding subunit [Dehalococcoidia bacterium]
MKRPVMLGTLFLVLVLVLGACAPKAAPSPSPTPTAPTAPSPAPSLGEWDKVLEAAKKEGTLTLYSTWAAEAGEAMKTGMSKYGIKLETIGGQGGDLELKIATEQRAKAYVADVFTGGWTNQTNTSQAGFGQPVTSALPSLGEKDVWKIYPGKYDPTNSVYVSGTGVTPSVVINTDLVKKGEITAWNDLLDPKWRDRIVMTDPRTGSGPGASGVWVFMPLGEDFWKKMAAQRITMQVRYDLAVNQVVYGEKALVLFPAFSRTVVAIRAGAPLQIVHLKEGTSYYLNGVVMVKNGPHPNASLVFLNWLFSKEGQIVVGKALGNYTIRNDVVEDWMKIPELNAGTFTVMEPPNNLDPEASKKAAEFAKNVFGK